MPTDPNAFRWVNWRVRGDEPKLARTLDYIDAALPPEWSMESGGDSSHPYGIARQYRFRPEGSAFPWTVPISWWAGRELHAGAVSLDVPRGATPDVRPQIGFSGLVRFLDEAIVPAATKAGATVYDPTPAELFFDELPIDTHEELRAFDAKARKTLPLEWDESEAWHEFVIAACRSSATFGRAPLTEWFESRGWARPAAEELTGQFFDQLQLLDRYRETLVIA